MKTYIHVNQHIIKANAVHGTNEPALTVKDYRQNRKAHRVRVNGPSELIYKPHDRPILPCGARLVLVTNSTVEVTK